MNKPNEKVLLTARSFIAEFIQQRRRELGITQEELADGTGLGIATIKRLEAGKFWINLKILLIICSALNCYFFMKAKEGDTD